MKILIFSLIFAPLLQASPGAPTGPAASAAADVKTTAAAHASAIPLGTPAASATPSAVSSAAMDVKSTAASASAAAGTPVPSVPSSAASDVKTSAAVAGQALPSETPAWQSWCPVIEGLVYQALPVCIDPLALKLLMKLSDDPVQRGLNFGLLLPHVMRWHYASAIKAAFPQGMIEPAPQGAVDWGVMTGNKPIEAIANDCYGNLYKHQDQIPQIADSVSKQLTSLRQPRVRHTYDSSVIEKWCKQGFVFYPTSDNFNLYHCSSCEPTPTKANLFTGLAWINPLFRHTCGKLGQASADELRYSVSPEVRQTAGQFLLHLLSHIDKQLFHHGNDRTKNNYLTLMWRYAQVLSAPQFAQALLRQQIWRDVTYQDKFDRLNQGDWRAHSQLIKSMVAGMMDKTEYGSSVFSAEQLDIARILTDGNPIEQALLLPTQAREGLTDLYTDILVALRPKIKSLERVAQEVGDAVALLPHVHNMISEFADSEQDGLPYVACDWPRVAATIAQGIGIDSDRNPFPNHVAEIIGNFAYHPTIEDIFDEVVTSQRATQWEADRKKITSLAQNIQTMYPHLNAHYKEILAKKKELYKGHCAALAYECNGARFIETPPIDFIMVPACFGCLQKTDGSMKPPSWFLTNNSKAWMFSLHHRECPNLKVRALYDTYPYMTSRVGFPSEFRTREAALADAMALLFNYTHCVYQQYREASAAERPLIYERTRRALDFESHMVSIVKCAHAIPNFAYYCKDPVKWTEKANSDREARFMSSLPRAQYEVPLPPKLKGDENAAAAAAGK